MSMLNHSPAVAGPPRAFICLLTEKIKSDFVSSIAMQKDPVCGMMVDERKTQLKSEKDGLTLYFCSAGCKAAFDKDPHRYGH